MKSILFQAFQLKPFAFHEKDQILTHRQYFSTDDLWFLLAWANQVQGEKTIPDPIVIKIYSTGDVLCPTHLCNSRYTAASQQRSDWGVKRSLIPLLRHLLTNLEQNVNLAFHLHKRAFKMVDLQPEGEVPLDRAV